MDTLAALQHGFAPALASALLHSLWQGTLLALAAACALAAMARQTAAARHAVAMGFLTAMVLLPAGGFLRFWQLSGEQLSEGLLPVMTVVEPVATPGMHAQASSAMHDAVVLMWLLGVAPALAEPLGAQLLALLFVVVLADLLLQPLLMRLLLPFSSEASPP